MRNSTRRHQDIFYLLLTAYCLLPVLGCTTPEYAIRPTPTPEESASARSIERTISAHQARDFERQGVRPIQPGERLWGFDVQRVVDRLSRVTERPSLHYLAWLLFDRDPNAAALADGRVYMTSGMLQYLASRGSHDSELAFILGHELGHTVAQHLVQRYRQIQKERLMLAVVGLGTSIATQGRGAQTQQLGKLAQDAASLAANVANSNYSQQQELEADQLGIRYVIRAGYDPRAALAMLDDFQRFDMPGGFLRTHPYIGVRREYLERYLRETGQLASAPAAAPTPPRAATPSLSAHSSTERIRFSAPSSSRPRDEARARLLEAQKLYPVGSQSWNNLQRQLDELDGRR